MFPGFKTPTLGLKATSAGNNLIIPFGTAVGRVQDVLTESGSNNLVLGSGIFVAYVDNASTGIPPSNNVILGCIDDIQNGYHGGSLGISGSHNIYIVNNSSGSGASNVKMSSSANEVILIGCFDFDKLPSNGSITIGYGAYNQDANYGIAIGTSSNVGGNYGVALGYSAGVGGSYGVALGYGANASGNYGVALGYGAHATSTFGVALGYSTICNALNSIAIGNTANAAQTNSTCIGFGATTDFSSETNLSNAGFAASGDIHISIFNYYGYSTSATPLELQVGTGAYSTAPASYITLTNNSSYAFTIDIVAQTKGGAVDCAMWTTQFLIQRGANAAATALVGTPSGLTTPTFATTGATTNGWAVAVTADTTNGRPAIKVTGVAATNISWVANVKMTKVGY